MTTSKKLQLSTESALFVGDTHADAGWLKFVVLPTAVKMGIDTIIQVGDFGYWPDSRKFMQVVKTARVKFGVDIWFIDGNHEHFTTLKRDVRGERRRWCPACPKETEIPWNLLRDSSTCPADRAYRCLAEVLPVSVAQLPSIALIASPGRVGSPRNGSTTRTSKQSRPAGTRTF